MNNLPIQTYESVVQQRDALEKKLADMAAENYALKVSQSQIYDYTQQFTSSDDREMWNAMHDIYKLSSPLETQATDAFLADVRAQGVDAAIKHLHKIFDGTDYIGEPLRALVWLEQALRKGINDAQ